MKKLVCILNHDGRSVEETFNSVKLLQNEVETFDLKIFHPHTKSSTDYIWYDIKWNQAKTYNRMLSYAKNNKHHTR